MVAVVLLAGAGFEVRKRMLLDASAMCMTIEKGAATAVMSTLGNLGRFVCAAAFGYLR